MPTHRELQDAHVQELVFRLHELHAVLEMDADLWYGGFPPPLEQLKSFVESQSNRLATVFEGVANSPRPEVE